MTVRDLALFAVGFIAVGIAVGAGAYHLTLPWVLARRGLPAVRALLAEVEALLVARRGRHLGAKP
jgi:hypothetical protein